MSKKGSSIISDVAEFGGIAVIFAIGLLCIAFIVGIAAILFIVGVVLIDNLEEERKNFKTYTKKKKIIFILQYTLSILLILSGIGIYIYFSIQNEAIAMFGAIVIVAITIVFMNEHLNNALQFVSENKKKTKKHKRKKSHKKI